MIRTIVAAVLATLSLGSISSASVDTTPEKTVYVSCEWVREQVAEDGGAAMIAVAQSNGISEKDFLVLARRCLR